MTFNKPLKTALAFLLFVCTSSMTKAATDSTAITLSHNLAPYIKLTGTAPGASRFYHNSELVNTVIPVPVNLGTMGVASNIPGDCVIDFSTEHTFELRHTVSGNNLGNYSILYKGETFNATNNSPLTITSCNMDPTDIDFKLTGLITFAGTDTPFVAAGIYRDVVKIKVTTQ